MLEILVLTKATTGDIGQHKWDTVMGDLVCSSVEELRQSEIQWLARVCYVRLSPMVTRLDCVSQS